MAGADSELCTSLPILHSLLSLSKAHPCHARSRRLGDRPQKSEILFDTGQDTITRERIGRMIAVGFTTAMSHRGFQFGNTTCRRATSVLATETTYSLCAHHNP